MYGRCSTLMGAAVVATMLVVGFVASPAHADPVKCKAGIIKAAAAFVQAKAKALAKCEEAIVKGKLPAGDCHADPKASATIAKAVTKLDASVAKACGGKDKICGTRRRRRAREHRLGHRLPELRKRQLQWRDHELRRHLLVPFLHRRGDHGSRDRDRVRRVGAERSEDAKGFEQVSGRDREGHVRLLRREVEGTRQVLGRGQRKQGDQPLPRSRRRESRGRHRQGRDQEARDHLQGVRRRRQALQRRRRPDARGHRLPGAMSLGDHSERSRVRWRDCHAR